MNSSSSEVAHSTDISLSRGAKRSRTGCLTCRRRHYKCDEQHPRCARCISDRRECIWHGNTGTRRRPPRSTSQEFDTTRVRDRGRHQVMLQAEREHASTHDYTVGQPLNTRYADSIVFYISKFHEFSYQLCAWTGLISLPKRSSIPSILQAKRRHDRRMTNWAVFFLPHLSTGSSEDPLSLALVAFTAMRLKDRITGMTFYAHLISQIRVILKRKAASAMGNQEFLRVWAATLLMAEYEALLGNEHFQSQHVEGATTLSFVAASRFPIGDTSAPSSSDQSMRGSIGAATTAGVDALALPSSPKSLLEVPRNERELPGYLMALTQRLRHSSTIYESLDTEWPTFQQPPIERQSLGGLLEKTAECYAHVMPLVEEFYTRMSIAPPSDPQSYSEMMTSFEPRVLAAKISIAEYRQMHAELTGADEVYHSCAEPGFPFSPIIKFINPQMAQPTVISHVFILFLAPFISDEEHYEALRYISGVFAGFEDVPGLQMDAVFPDLYVAAFWKRGIERDYFQQEESRRQGDFLFVLKKIWGTIDFIEMTQGRIPTKTEILGISFKEYKDARKRNLRLQHTRH